ncbi:MAG: hypothetical protein M1482_13325 [Chloroflexi bacterium]|nr:hypothetical protein [Chloroflexota bacterium]
MKFARNVLRFWLPLAVVITLLAGLLYGVVQQVNRISANDPQIQLAQDAASALSAGEPVALVVPADKVDIAHSLAPYVVAFDDSGKVVASSGYLNGAYPALPSGVFDYVRANGEDRITWQPQPGVRSALVVTRVSGPQPGFVMAGRSLREVENRIDGIGLLVVLGWLGTLAASLAAVVGAEFLFGDSVDLSVERVKSLRTWSHLPRVFRGAQG